MSLKWESNLRRSSTQTHVELTRILESSSRTMISLSSMKVSQTVFNSNLTILLVDHDSRPSPKRAAGVPSPVKGRKTETQDLYRTFLPDPPDREGTYKLADEPSLKDGQV